MRTPRLLTFVVLAAAGATALAQEIPSQGQPAGYGTSLPSGSKVTTTLSNDLDVDDYVFRGYPGQKVTTSIKIDKKSVVKMHLELIRPDGTVVAADDPNAKFKTGEEISDNVRFENPGGDPPFQDVEAGTVAQTSKIQYVLEQVGTWKVRVRAPELDVPVGDSGEYTLSVKYTTPPKTKLKDVEPTGNQSYSFPIAAEGGSRLDFKFSFKGGEATFNGLRAPNGDFIDVDKLKTKAGKFIEGKKIVLHDDDPVGDYTVTFVYPEGVNLTNVKFNSKVKLPKGAKKRKGRLSGAEPLISTAGINPEIGGPPTVVTVTILNGFDPPDNANAIPELMLNDRPMDIQAITDNGTSVTIRALVGTVGEGTFDVVTRTATGQVAVLQNGFTRVPPPVVSQIDPVVGSAAGGFEVTIAGEGFPEDLSQIGILIDGNDVPVQKTFVSSTEVRFIAPPRAPTFVTFGVRDLRSQLSANLPINSFEYLSTPGISRITPGLVPILGGDTIFVRGTNFRPTDTVYMETATPGQFEVVAGPTFLRSDLHSFPAPIRPKGRYEIYVEDEQGVRTQGRRTVGFFQYADFTDESGLTGPPENDLNDGWTTALSDFDQDGDLDLFIAKRGPESGRADTSQITIFENDGSGEFTKSADRIPAPAPLDDWRADRILVEDVTQDGWPDIVITSDDTAVLSPTVSHTRILTSTKRSSQSELEDRVFVDRTFELMPPPRVGKSGVSNSDGDNWRGLDMWVGDIDSGPVGPPEILITHNEVKEELSVLCGNYCNTTITGNAHYSFYWGGSRAFVWDPNARGGQGQYKFEHNFFPRKSGVVVPIGNPPPGVTIPNCSPGTCRGTFTPFTGHLLRVADMNADRRPDVVVASDQVVNKNGQPISSTQVGLFGFSAETGSFLTDVTDKLTNLGGETRADAAQIGLFGYPDGNSFGTIVLTQAEAGSGRAIRLLKFTPSIVPGEDGTFVDITNNVVPQASGNEAWQASALQVVDVDTDGDQDLVLVADAAPGTGEAAFRILRNVIEGNQIGILRPDFEGLIDVIVSQDEPFDGTSLEIGDLDGDGGVEFVITRDSVPSGEDDTQTRVIATDQ
jgi:hypothetical protein